MAVMHACNVGSDTCACNSPLLECLGGLTWNLEVMSKCFFMSVPSTWAMVTPRITPLCSALTLSFCTASTLMQCLQTLTQTSCSVCKPRPKPHAVFANPDPNLMQCLQTPTQTSCSVCKPKSKPMYSIVSYNAILSQLGFMLAGVTASDQQETL